MMSKKFVNKMLVIFHPLLLGAVVGFLTNQSAFKTMNKPIFSPPGWIFPVVWSILYILMGISLYIAKNNKLSDTGYRYYIIQLVLNLLWSFIFFNFKWYLISILWILIMIFFVIKMLIEFYKTKKVAGYLQLPYLLWLLVALYLAVGVWFLN